MVFWRAVWALWERESDREFSADVAVATIILNARSLFFSTFINFFTGSAGRFPGKMTVNRRSER